MNRSEGKGTGAKKSGTGIVVVGLLVVGAWMGFFSPDSSSNDKPAPEPSSVSSSVGR
ncbi:hypothetical protein [Streptomyces cyaneochromogenes]|uniref:hypothetical protein n=1 Tax=Streptomyces cyaneochromogenes TaxID=2496836 RepID=UPI00158DD21E|nr:hypothetical protein [Streptomyces cyaneochromogenes]